MNKELQEEREAHEETVYHLEIACNMLKDLLQKNAAPEPRVRTCMQNFLNEMDALYNEAPEPQAPKVPHLRRVK